MNFAGGTIPSTYTDSSAAGLVNFCSSFANSQRAFQYGMVTFCKVTARIANNHATTSSDFGAYAGYCIRKVQYVGGSPSSPSFVMPLLGNNNWMLDKKAKLGMIQANPTNGKNVRTVTVKYRIGEMSNITRKQAMTTRTDYQFISSNTVVADPNQNCVLEMAFFDAAFHATTTATFDITVILTVDYWVTFLDPRQQVYG